MKERLVGMLASPSPTRSAPRSRTTPPRPTGSSSAWSMSRPLQGLHRGLGVDSRKRLPLIVVPPSEPTA